jgi:hypothetical protein
MIRSKKFKAPYIFALAVSFFVFVFFLFLRSFPAEYNIYLRYLERMQTSDPFWTSFWFGSELVGEVGLIFRFLGACFFLVFTWLLLTRHDFVISHLKRAVIFEGSYYIFMVPFILSLYLRPNTTLVYLEAGLSYTLQILFISPAFFMLYYKLRKTTVDKAELFRWGAIAVVGFTFGLWIKHFLLTLYALPISLDNTVLVLGFLNSTFTILVAGIILLVSFWPIIRKQSLNFNVRMVGVGFFLTGLYFIVYIAVSLFSQRYWDFLMLTELWALGFIILSVGYIASQSTQQLQQHLHIQ